METRCHAGPIVHGTPRKSGLTGACIWTLLVAIAAQGLAAPPASRPHIVVFLADDLSWNDCSIYGTEAGIKTPNMERLARDGKTFTHAFVVSPSCAPSRAALLTGLNPARNGAMFNHTVPDPSHRRWPAWFRESGYETVAMGKVAHYATVRQYGFDHASHFKYHEDDCISAAIDWLKKRTSDQPLCLLVGTNWPHVPWPEKTSYKADQISLPSTQVDTPETRQWRARYAAAVESADRDLGLIYDATRAALGENTLFVFTSDHGSQFPFGKWNCYDDGIRTPLIAVWPGRIQAGSRTGAMISWIDLLPTCLEASGATPPETGSRPGQLSGQSFLPVLLGQQESHRRRVFATHSGDGKMNEYPMRALRTATWKYIRNLAPDAKHHTHIDRAENTGGKGYWSSWIAAAQQDPHAAQVVRRYHQRPREELYDLVADPWELKNLADDPQHLKRLTEMRQQLDEWMAAENDLGLPTEQAHKKL